LYTFHGTKETILYYAWLCSREDLRSAVRMKDKEQWQRNGREELVLRLLEAEVAKVDISSLYGSILRYGAARVDADTIRATIDESGGIYFREAALNDTEQQEADAQEVTDLLLRSIEQDERLLYNLEPLCQTWKEDGIAGASALRDFFLLHTCLTLRGQDLASFVSEMVCVQLQRVCWFALVDSLLQRGFSSLKGPLQEVLTYARHEAVRRALLKESIWQISREFGMFSGMPQLSHAATVQAHAFSGMCRDLAHALN